MSSRDSERARANKITNRAVDREPIRGVVGNGATILQVFGVAKEYSANDLVAYGGSGVANSGGSESGTLTVVIISYVTLM